MNLYRLYAAGSDTEFTVLIVFASSISAALMYARQAADNSPAFRRFADSDTVQVTRIADPGIVAEF